MSDTSGTMQGKVCLVTGATSGIGKATAIGLARMGATVIAGCRNDDKGQKALTEIKSLSGKQEIDLFIADLSSQTQIRKAVEELRKKYANLHVLVNNAGVSLFKRSVTEDGIETILAVNYIAPFYLTNLLLPLLRSSAPARVVNIISSAHADMIDFEDLMSEKSFHPQQVYGQSKLALMIFTFDLANRLRGTGVTVNCLHPGVVRTNLTRHVTSIYRVVAAVTRPFFLSPQKGAETSIYAASSAEIEGVTGKYFAKKKEVSVPKASYDEPAAKKLWEISLQLTGLMQK